MFEHTKGVITIRNSENRQDNGQNNDLQNTTLKTNDRVTRTPLKTGDELRCSGRVNSSCSTSGTRRVTLVTNPVISHKTLFSEQLVELSLYTLTSFVFIFVVFQTWISVCCIVKLFFDYILSTCKHTYCDIIKRWYSDHNFCVSFDSYRQNEIKR